MTRRIVGFDALRAISVGLVILTHVGVVGAVNGASTALDGQTGVRTFFVLSGFLITSLLMAEHDRTGRIGLRRFAVRRALRIFPAYFLATGVVLLLAGSIIKPGTLVYVLTYTYNFVGGGFGVHFLDHFWTLSVEEHFYLIWPAIMLIGYRHARVLGWSCFAFVAVNLALLQAGILYEHWTLPATFPIAIGCLAALNAVRLRALFRVPASLVWSVALVISTVVLPGVPGLATSALGSAGVILWIFHNQDRRAVQRMDWGPIGYLGTISYGLYIWQGIFTGNGLERPFGSFPPSNPLVCVGLTLMFAIASWHLYERPILRLKDRLGDSRRSRTDAPLLD
jgi:peptidoglycan/LPS O-acetylase OafA/YrhL